MLSAPSGDDGASGPPIMLMVDVLQLGALLLAAALAVVLHHAMRPRPDAAAPPLVPGWPLLGNTISLGLSGAKYIHACRLKHGDVYTLNLAGRSMTFVFRSDALAAFFSAPDADIVFR